LGKIRSSGRGQAKVIHQRLLIEISTPILPEGKPWRKGEVTKFPAARYGKRLGKVASERARRV
jgi:hypothetical protein